MSSGSSRISVLEKKTEGHIDVSSEETKFGKV